MAKSTFADQSTTPGSNTSLDGNDVSENCSMAGMNNAMRSLAAMGKSAGTFIATTGTDTYLATFAPIPDALATDFLYGFNFTSANTSTTPNLSPSGLGPKTIVDMSGNALGVGALNGRHILIYDGTNFRVLNPRGVISIADATNGGLNFSAALGSITGNLKPSDLLTKTTPTNSDSVMIMDAAAANVAKTATIPQVVGAFFAPITNSLSGDVALNSTSLYRDGPSVAQGTSGTWYASGTVTLSSTGSDVMQGKLWDGTTVIASATLATSPNLSITMSLSGFIASPAGNIRISVRDPTSTAGTMAFNAGGNSKDSTLTAIRIG